MPENIATGSSANYNYASVQKDTQHWHNHCACFRQDIEIIDLKQAFEMFLSIACVREPQLRKIFTGEIYPVIPTFYWKEEEHADPVKQAEARQMYLQMGALALSDVQMKLGYDPEDQMAKVKADVDEMKEYRPNQDGLPADGAGSICGYQAGER